MTESRWYVSVDGQQLDGEHSLESARELVQKNLGKRVLVWSQGMAQWALPEDLPQFKMPIPKPAPAPEPAPKQEISEPRQPAVTLDKEEMKKQAGFLKALLDFRFNNLITTKVIPVLYAIVVVLLALAAVGYVLLGGGGMILTGIRFKSSFPVFTGLLIMVVTPLVAVVYLALIRIWFEIVLVIFRIKEDLTELVAKGKEQKEGDKK